MPFDRLFSGRLIKYSVFTHWISFLLLDPSNGWCFQRISQVGRIKDGYNPATWVLEVTTRAQEDHFGVKFADIYKNSDLYKLV